jgi:Fe-S cluster assembly ATP-binding protein
MLLKINNLSVSVEDKEILRNYNLEIKKGEIHAIMGPNGSGKSTLSKVIMGAPHYKITTGNIFFNNSDIAQVPTDQRARLGLFLAMQAPIEIEGVSNIDFLRTALGSKNNNNINLYQFIKQVDTLIEDLNMDKKMIHRSINKGFSGGEKKKNEVLQMKLLEPIMIILDEIDSGLDIDSLKIVAKNINDYKKKNKDISILIITHYPRILNDIKPDYVHIMTCGKIVKTGDYNLALEIENKGYQPLDKTCTVEDIESNE